jgi:hypothetical protein
MNEDYGFSPQAVLMGLGDVQREGYGDGRIESIPAPFKNAHADLRRDPVRRRDGAKRA